MPDLTKQDYERLLYARSLRDRVVGRFGLDMVTTNSTTLRAFGDFLGIESSAKADRWVTCLLIEARVSADTMQKLEALAGPHGYAYYKTLVVRGVLPDLKISPVV